MAGFASASQPSAGFASGYRGVAPRCSLAASGKFRGSQDQDGGRHWSQSSIHEAN
ncbi:hypothetical protein C4K25_3208 [Pseudomonas chlororaphis]|nr:hypothetical protein C4K25_3208 [Pseudomonas chlororaphis]